jgi:hypothetical protein
VFVTARGASGDAGCDAGRTASLVIFLVSMVCRTMPGECIRRSPTGEDADGLDRGRAPDHDWRA